MISNHLTHNQRGFTRRGHPFGAHQLKVFHLSEVDDDAKAQGEIPSPQQDHAKSKGNRDNSTKNARPRHIFGESFPKGHYPMLVVPRLQT